MSQLSGHEQQQVDIASENYEADYFNKPEAKGPLDHFKAGVDFALQHLFAGRMEAEATRADGLVGALEYLMNDVRNKPNDTRYATALKKATEALNNYNKTDK